MNEKKKSEKPNGLIRNTWNKIWNKTNGWKTIGGIALHAVWIGIHRSAGIDWDTAWKGHAAIGTLTGTGAGHKAQKFVKSETGKKIIGWVGKLLKIK